MRERWLGSIDLEIYRDGELVEPTDTTSARRPKAAPGLVPAEEGSGKTATLYFAYHNDNAADLNLKFLAEDLEGTSLVNYLQNGEFNVETATDNYTNGYVIDAVYAEQGGSEDGLKYMYNWLDSLKGGRLDNVRGGSTVKIYVTTMYQVKYYFDQDDGNGYQEMTDAAHKNENFYTTPGTENAVNANTEAADYVVQKGGDQYQELIEQTPSSTEKFVDENIRRGEYSYFQYLFNEYDHVIPIASLPEAPEGYTLDSDKWTIRDKALAALTTQAPDTDMTVTETSYGTGNSKYSYQNEGLDDVTNTYHLYIKVVSNNTSISVTKIWNDGKDRDAIRPDADEFKDSIGLYADGELVTDAVPTVTDNGDDTYTITYNQLPKTNDSGRDIVYTIKETAPEGYTIKDNKAEAADGESITNEYTPETTEIEITKKWEDADDQDGLRMSAEDFAGRLTLEADGDELSTQPEPTVTDNGDGTYTVKYTDLPKNRKGKAKVYSIREKTVTGYTAKDDKKTAEDGETITNVHEPAVTEVSITKRWDDADDHDGFRLTADEYKAKVHLFADGTEVTDKDATVTDNGDGTYTVKYTDLPKNKAGKAVTYTVKEDAVDQYTASVNDEAADTVPAGGTIVNKHEPVIIDVEITKQWDDGDDQDGLRLTADEYKAKVHLYADGTEVTDKDAAVTDNGDGTFTVKYTGLSKYKDGKAVRYTIREDAVDKYEAKDGKTEAADGETITNVHKPELTDVEITKVWDDADDQDGYRLSDEDFAAKIHLYAGDKEVTDVTPSVTDNGDGTYTVKYTDLPKNEGGEAIEYIVKEDAASKYTAKDGKDEVADGETITNVHEPEKTEIEVTKKWDDMDDVDQIRPESITVKLMKKVGDGEATEAATLEIKASENWKGSFKDLPVNEKGKKIEYSIEEVTVDDYTTEMSGDPESGYVITNTHSPMGDLRIEKSLPVYKAEAEGYFVFSIKAVKDGKTVYEGVEELTFTEAGEKSITIEGKIPVGAEVTVTESYTGAGYELSSEKTVKVIIKGTKESGSPATVAFENKAGDSFVSGSGITNEFTYNGEDWEHTEGGAEE